MRMILVHGIAEEGKNSQIILDYWTNALRKTITKSGSDPLDRLVKTDAAYYGDLLAELSSLRLSSEAIALGADDATDDFDEFAVGAFEEMALRMELLPGCKSRPKKRKLQYPWERDRTRSGSKRLPAL